MKIGIMARTFDDPDGVGIANRNLIDKMLEIDRETEYVVFHRSRSRLGMYRHYPNVRELVLRAPNKLVWDQVMVPYYARRERVDVIFHPKYTVPLLTTRPTVVVNQGLEYYTLPQFYPRLDLTYVKLFLPIYYRKATKVLAISEDLRRLTERYLRVPYDEIEIMYLAPGEHFFPRTDARELGVFQQRHALPDDFIVTVTKAYQGGKLADRKNISGIVHSFMALKGEFPTLKLVLAGEHCHQFMTTVFGREVADDPRFVYPGWIPQTDMPYLYSLAKALVFPSHSESFGLPLAEAMACGCPVVTSTGGSCSEVVGDAGLVIDATDQAGLLNAVRRVLADPQLRQQLQAKGLERAKHFTWERSARKVISVCQGVYETTRRRSDGLPRESSRLHAT